MPPPGKSRSRNSREIWHFQTPELPGVKVWDPGSNFNLQKGLNLPEISSNFGNLTENPHKPKKMSATVGLFLDISPYSFKEYRILGF